MPLGKWTAGAGALALAGLLGACAGGGDQNYYAKQCSARGLAPDGAGWQACLDDERYALESERRMQNSIRWGI
ncbi:MAG: hypothetical protein RIB84_28330 [Sneathiellaceae bacterium]